jgi:hypothetical protein
MSTVLEKQHNGDEESHMYELATANHIAMIATSQNATPFLYAQIK